MIHVTLLNLLLKQINVINIILNVKEVQPKVYFGRYKMFLLLPKGKK